MQLLVADYPPAPAPDPFTFEPSRWDSWHPKSWHYIPFNGGPRLCVGQQFALTEMAYTITRLLQRFGRIESRMYNLTGAGHRDQYHMMEKGTAMPMQSQIVLAPDLPVEVAFFKE